MLGTKNEIIRGVGNGKANKTVQNLSKSKILKNSKYKELTYIKATEKPLFLTFTAKKVLNCLKQAFIKVLIFEHFDLECLIGIETNASSYIIGGVLSHLIFNQLIFQHLAD